jgi:hypothetical protein
VDARRIDAPRKGGASWATVCRETGLSKVQRSAPL